MSSTRFGISGSLDVWRGVAALWVFAFHIGAMLESVHPALGRFAAFGHLGVPMFFVISGFVMHVSARRLAGQPRAVRTFLKRRLRRIYPPFWVAVLVAVVAPFVMEAISAIKSGSYVMPVRGFMDFTAPDWVSLLTLTRVFQTPDGDLQAMFAPVNAVFWTLAIEVQFYIVVAVSLAWAGRWRWILLLVTLLSFIAPWCDWIQKSGLFLRYWPAFACGLLLAEWDERRERGSTEYRLASMAAAWISLLLPLLVASLAATGDLGRALTLGGKFDSEFLSMAVVMAIYLWLSSPLKVQGNRVGAVLRSIARPMAWVGVFSYSLYLVHGRIYPIAEMFVRQAVAGANPAYPLLVMLATLAAAYVFYLLFEKPFLSSGGGRKRPAAPAATS